MTSKIFRSIFATSLVVLAATLVIITSFLYDYFMNIQINQLIDELSIASVGTEQSGEKYLENLKSDNFRLTWIAGDGTVLFDSQADKTAMDNHLDREEITEAFETGKGSSSRRSATLTEKTLYEAVLLSDGTVLRISVNRASGFVLLLGMMTPVIIVVIIAVIISAVLAHKMSKRIIEPLNKLDLDNPTENEAYEEIAPLLSRIHKQNMKIERKAAELNRRKDEFELITKNMREGLVLLDKKGMVLSINAAAKKLFGASDTAVGRDFLTLDRSTDMSRAIEKALDGKRAEFREERHGSEYQFVINRTESDGKTVGIVILCFDVTETAFAERNRKEFTANVSHELKTPLQSIIGSAELLENGLVKPEDTKRFVGNIKNEATRLVSLINDIIRFSQLDEDSEPATESVDLYDVVNEVIEVLTVSAAKKQVELHLNGESCVMNGIRRYLYEIIYNLCDNAIRYNKDGGKVTVDLKNTDGKIVLSVSDTGIGIPAEHQSRIFERFYRVDKSHSKETGGTGLGLSIVKHAVAYHGGKIKLDSKVGEGTTITIVF